MIRLPLALLLLSSMVGCPSTAPPPPAAPPTDRPSTPPDEEPAEPPAAVEDPADSPPGCAAGGRPWDGKPENCSYEHGGCCYDAAGDACAAAGCAADRCNILESYPAQIACADG